MTRALPAPVTAPVEPPPVPAPAPRRRPHRAAVCTVTTVAALTPAVVTGPPWTPWAATALAAGTVVWGGWPLHRAAWEGLHRGGSTLDVLPGAGVVAAALAAASAGPLAGAAPACFLPAVVAAAATTLLLVGRAAEDRAARSADAWQPVDAPAAATPEAIDDPGPSTAAEHATTAEVRREAAGLRHVADRITGRFAWVVIALAVGTLGFWLGAGARPAAAFGAAAAVLLVACPHTVGRAASTAVLAAAGRAVTLGARPVGSGVLRRAPRVDTVVLCRTGTVTAGPRTLRAVHTVDGVEPDEALRVAGAVATAAQEAGGTAGGHPVGGVVARAAAERFETLPGVAEFDGYPGLGVRGVVTELRPGPDEPRVIAHATLVGRPALLAQHGITLPPDLATAVQEVHAAGSTAVAVSWDGVARAVLEVAAPVRPGIVEAVRELRALGLVTVLLTGDDAGAARGLAAALGVDPDHVLAEVARADRGTVVADLRLQGRTVAVLGGPGDAAALGAADVALVRDDAATAAEPGPVAAAEVDDPLALTGAYPSSPAAGCVVGAAGGHVALRDADPFTAVDALRTTRRAVAAVDRVVTATLTYHLVALPLAAAGLLPPLAAAAGAAVWPAAGVLHTVAVRRTRPAPRPTAE